MIECQFFITLLIVVSQTEPTDKLHIIVHSHTMNPRAPVDQQPDPRLMIWTYSIK